jgi:prolyl-tRNA synthetase
MKLSQLFTKTIKEAPADETATNAKLLIRGGFVHKEMAGVYSYLPLGLRVMKKIEDIIRQEMNRIGGIEMKTSVLQNKEIWEKSNRWSDEVVDNWFKTELKNGGKAGLSFTNEEAYSNILKQYVNSYKDLPIYPYDFKEIFRNETRSKSGILRGREFYWKAMYSFSKNENEHNNFYEKATEVYKNIFNRVGIGDKTYLTYSSGGTFSKFSHEFQTLCEAGEDTIYISENDYGEGLKMKEGHAALNPRAFNKEIWTDELREDLKLEGKFREEKAIEVGNIFTLGTRFSEPFDLTFIDEDGGKKFVFMGSYGIGLSRLMGTIVEVFHDDKGIIWPEAVAPFKVHLISLEKNSDGERIYNNLLSNNIEVLYDDRDDKTPGEKFADADLIGCPIRLVLGNKMGDGEIEIKKRAEKNSEIIKQKDLLGAL